MNYLNYNRSYNQIYNRSYNQIYNRSYYVKN